MAGPTRQDQLDDLALSLMLDDELALDDRDELRRVFDEDPGQRKHFEALSETVFALRALPMEEAPADFLRGVQSRIRRRSRGRYYSHKVRYRFPYEAVFNGVLLGILVAIYLIALPAPVKVPPPVDPAIFQAGGAPVSVGVAVLRQYGEVTVETTGGDGGFVVYRAVIEEARVDALVRELSLYPDLVMLGQPMAAEAPAMTVVRVRAPSLPIPAAGGR